MPSGHMTACCARVRRLPTGSHRQIHTYRVPMGRVPMARIVHQARRAWRPQPVCPAFQQSLLSLRCRLCQLCQLCQLRRKRLHHHLQRSSSVRGRLHPWHKFHHPHHTLVWAPPHQRCQWRRRILPRRHTYQLTIQRQ